MPPMLDEPKMNALQPAGRFGFVRQLSAKIAQLLTTKDLTTYPQPGNQKTSQTGAGETAFMSVSHQAWRVHWDRRAIYFDLKEMAQSDPLISTALDVLADCTTGFEDTDADSF